MYEDLEEEYHAVPAIVMDSRTFSCPSGGSMQMAAMSLTASSMTCGSDGESDRAISVTASLCSKMSFSPTLLFMMAFRHRMHSCWTFSHLLSL